MLEAFLVVNNIDREETRLGGIGLDGHSLLPAQSQMARAALRWSLYQAASAAGLSYRTILRFEKEQRDVQPELIGDLRRAFEEAGVRFIEEGIDAGDVVPPARCVLRAN